MSYWWSTVVKMDASGFHWTVVPLRSVSPRTSRSLDLIPRANSIAWTLPCLWTVTLSQSESAFTQLTPTPCRPPETL